MVVILHWVLNLYCFLFFLNIFNARLVESADVKPRIWGATCIKHLQSARDWRRQRHISPQERGGGQVKAVSVHTSEGTWPRSDSGRPKIKHLSSERKDPE